MSSRQPISVISDKRPSSGSSRSAWNDDGLDAPGRPESGSSTGSSSTAKRDVTSAAPDNERRKRRVKKPKKENFCQKILGGKLHDYVQRF